LKNSEDPKTVHFVDSIVSHNSHSEGEENRRTKIILCWTRIKLWLRKITATSFKMLG